MGHVSNSRAPAFLAEIGFAVAFGILLDTIVVRSVLVTALNLDLGRWIWWPGKRRAEQRYRRLDALLATMSHTDEKDGADDVNAPPDGHRG